MKDKLDARGRLEVSLGYTGSRNGMSKAQLEIWAGEFVPPNYWSWVMSGDADEHVVTMVHLGGCVGGDEEAARVCWALRVPVTVHLPIDKGYASVWTTEMCVKDDLFTAVKPLGYHERDRNIVDHSDYVLSFPLEAKDPGHGGTWYTTRYAQKQRKKVLVYPRELFS